MEAFKALAATLYQRVIVAYRSTLLGMAIIAVSETANALQVSTSPAVRIGAAVLGMVLVLLKAKQAAAPPPPAA